MIKKGGENLLEFLEQTWKMKKLNPVNLEKMNLVLRVFAKS